MKERKIILFDGDESMGGLYYIFNTNAPKKLLKEMEERSKTEEDLIWMEEISNNTNYFFDYVGEYTCVSPYGTADDLIERDYGKLEQYCSYDYQKEYGWE